MVPLEFQGIVMAAGKGSRMTELTARRPKCLLPVGNLPMLWYPLNFLERLGFSEAIVVVLEGNKSEVQSALEKCTLKIKFELVGIPSGEDWGTADSLRYLSETNKIKSDLVIVPCDLVGDVNLNPALDLYLKHNASLCATFVDNSSVQFNYPTPGPKSKDKTERDFVGIDPVTSRLVFIASASDYEESLPFSKKLLNRYGKISVHSKLTDTHIYILNKWVLNYLSVNKSLSTLKGEVIPHIVRKHLYSGNKSKVDVDKDKTSVFCVDPKNDISELAVDNDLMLRIRMLSTHTDRRFQPAYNDDTIRCYAYIVSDDSVAAARANTLKEYCSVNRRVNHFWKILNKEELNVISGPGKEDCIISDKAQIAERTTLKHSIIGPSAVISTKTRIDNTVVMNGAKVGERCVIDNCVICEEAVIEDGCNLKDCLIGSHHKIASGSKHAMEMLTDTEQLMEI